MKRSPEDLLIEHLWRERRRARIHMRKLARAVRRYGSAFTAARHEACVWRVNCRMRLDSYERERARAKMWRGRAEAAGWKPSLEEELP